MTDISGAAYHPESNKHIFSVSRNTGACQRNVLSGQHEKLLPDTLFLTDQDITLAADWASAIDVLRRAYSAPVNPASVPPRSMERGSGVWLRSLIAISPLDGYMGCKLISASVSARRASYLVSLFNRSSMNLDALLDGNQITGIRTAATAVVAVDALAPKRPLRVALLGSGFEARAQLAALVGEREIESVKVFSPTPEKRGAFAEHSRKTFKLDVAPVAHARAAVRNSDVVICAARARAESPILFGSWLEPGMTITSIGSTLPEQREVDTTVVAQANLIIADTPEEVSGDTGDMIAARHAGLDFHKKLVSLEDLLAGHRTVRRSPTDIVMYKSVGSALQDVVIAEMLLARARELRLGTVLPVGVTPVAK